MSRLSSHTRLASQALQSSRAVLGAALLTLVGGCQPQFAADPGEGSTFSFGPDFSAFTGSVTDDGPATAPAVADAPAPPTVPAEASGAVGASEEFRLPTSNMRAGSRLHSRVVSTYEGFESWVGWYDSELGEDCAFEPDSTGTPRCLPKQASRAVYYLDEECEQGVAAVEDDHPLPRYAYERRKGPCYQGSVIYSLGAPAEVPNRLFARSSSGVCNSVERDVVASTFLSIERRVDPEVFVSARRAVEETSARVKAVGLLANDGTIEVTGFLDSALDAQCVWSNEREATCVPNANEIILFADDALSQPLLGVSGDSCQPDRTLGVSYVDDACGAYFGPGRSFQGSLVYELAPGSLTQRSVQASEVDALFLGEPVATAELAAGKLRRAHVDTRLAPVHVATTDGGKWFGHWHDTLLDVDCDFRNLAGVGWVCVPQGATEQLLWADAACSDPVTPGPAVDGCGTASTAPTFVIKSTTATDTASPLEVRAVGPARPYLSVVYRKAPDGQCLPEPPDTTRSYFSVGPAMDASRLIQGFVETR